MTTIDLLTRLGARLVPIDRWPGPFAMGSSWSECPRCGLISLFVARDHWQASCRCWGRPWRKLGRLDALIAIMRAESAA